ncbi:MAG: helix-turn-helix domain-containing protein, partial [Gemmatimonadaceae bacterium]
VETVSGTAMCAMLAVSRPTVSRWLNRYAAEGIEGLAADKPRSGRPKALDAATEAAILTQTLQEPPPDGGTHWSGRLMAQTVGVHQTFPR